MDGAFYRVSHCGNVAALADERTPNAFGGSGLLLAMADGRGAAPALPAPRVPVRVAKLMGTVADALNGCGPRACNIFGAVMRVSACPETPPLNTSSPWPPSGEPSGCHAYPTADDGCGMPHAQSAWVGT